MINLQWLDVLDPHPYQWQMQDFPEGGHQLPKWDYFFNYFAENCMKMKEFGPLGGPRVPGAPLRSANAYKIAPNANSTKSAVVTGLTPNDGCANNVQNNIILKKISGIAKPKEENSTL